MSPSSRLLPDELPKWPPPPPALLVAARAAAEAALFRLPFITRPTITARRSSCRGSIQCFSCAI